MTSMLCDHYSDFPTFAQESQQSASRGRVLAFYSIAPCLSLSDDYIAPIPKHDVTLKYNNNNNNNKVYLNCKNKIKLDLDFLYFIL